MATILDKLSPSAELGERVGRGVSSGLQSLIDNKLSQLQKQAGLIGTMDPQQAKMLSMLPDNLFNIIAPQIMKNQQYEKGLAAYDRDQNQQPGNQFNDLINPEQMVQPGVGLGSNGPQANQEILQQVLGSQQGGQVQPGQSMYEQQMQQQAAQQKAVGNGVLPKEQQRMAADNARINEAARKAYIATNGDKRAAQQAIESEKNRIIKERLAETKEFQQDKQFAFKETKKYRDQLSTAAKNARSDIENLKMQRDLVRSGELIGPRKKVLLDVVGNYFKLDESGKSALLSGVNQVFEKLSLPYFRELKEKFGAKPTQWDAQQLQKSFPSLYQTDAGKEVIIEFMMHDRESNIKEENISRDIIKNNGGIPPTDLSSQTGDQLSKWKDKKYLNLRNKVSRILAKESGPSNSAADAGKGALLESDSGVVWRSNGRDWDLAFSDTLGE